MRRVVVVVDDLGLCPEINRAVRDVHAAGVVRAASLLVSGNAFEDGVATVRDCRGLAPGLHLSFVETPPVLPPEQVPDLYPRGRPFHSHRDFLWAWIRGQVSAESLLRETRAQVDRFRATGLPLTHVSGHQHLHLLPPVVRLLCELGIPWIRVPRDLIWGRRPFEAAALRLLSWPAARRIRSHGLRCADAFRGFHMAGRLDARALHRLLQDLPDGVTEIACHPACPGPGLEPFRAWRYHWAAETAALSDAGLLRRMRELGIEPVRPDEA